MIIYDVYFMYFTKKKRLQKESMKTTSNWILTGKWTWIVKSHRTLTNTCDFLHYSPVTFLHYSPFHLTHMA